MSEEDVLLAKARTQEEYLQCRARFSALESEARRAIALLEKVCGYLRGGGKDSFSSGGLEELLSGKLIDLMGDLHETRRRREVLYDSLKGMGWEPKD